VSSVIFLIASLFILNIATL